MSARNIAKTMMEVGEGDTLSGRSGTNHHPADAHYENLNNQMLQTDTPASKKRQRRRFSKAKRNG
jgi:hypothetical protein